MSNRTRHLMVGLSATCVVVLTAGAAFAVSSGGYDPVQQDCTPTADAWSTVNSTQPGCSNFKLNVEDGSGHRYGEFGIDQLPAKTNAHSGTYRSNTNSDGSGAGVSGTYDTHYQPIPPNGPDEFGLLFYPVTVALCAASGTPPTQCVFTPNLPDPNTPPEVKPTVQSGTPDTSSLALVTGTSVYLGADDNLDTGEHDGVDSNNGTANSANGPSDGGALVANWHPLDVATWLTTVAGGGSPDTYAALTNPVPVADAGEGECADGICLSIQTRQRAVYNGGGGSDGTYQNRDVYNYDGKQWDPQGCSSGDLKGEAACNGTGLNGYSQTSMDGWRQAEAKNVNAEPGVQFYEDPDPQGSPIGSYPLPAAYVGTCGVAAGGGVVPVPNSPVTNKSGQVIVSTGC